MPFDQTTIFTEPEQPPSFDDQPSAKRSLYWPGFALGLLLTAAVSCGGLATLLGLNEISLADIRSDGAPVWTPPTALPTTEVAINAASDSVTTDAGIGRFQLDDQVRNMTQSRVNIRRTPGYLGKDGADVVAQVQPGATMQIVDGPVEADNLIWWTISYRTANGSSVEGWVAEATGSGVTILGQ